MSRFILICLLFLAGCATATHVEKITFQTSAFGAPPANPRPSFDIVAMPGGKWTDNDLEFQWVSANFALSLVAKGYRLASAGEPVDVLISLEAFVEPPTYGSYQVNAPVFGQTGGGMSTSNAVVYTPKGPVYASGTTYTQPTFGVVGTRTRTVNTASYGYRVSAIAYDAAQVPAKGSTSNVLPRQLWKVTAACVAKQPIPIREGLARLAVLAASKAGVNGDGPLVTWKLSDFLSTITLPAELPPPAPAK